MVLAAAELAAIDAANIADSHRPDLDVTGADLTIATVAVDLAPAVGDLTVAIETVAPGIVLDIDMCTVLWHTFARVGRLPRFPFV